MKETITKLIVNIISLLIVTTLFTGIYIDSLYTTVIAAILLTVVNVFLKPVILILTLPINIFSLGLFTFIINGMMFYLVSVLVPGFQVESFSWAVFGSIIFGLTNFFINVIFIPRKRPRQPYTVTYQQQGPSLQGEEDTDIIDAEIIEEKRDNPEEK